MQQITDFLNQDVVTLNGLHVTVGIVLLLVLVWLAWDKLK